jgi:hypothetical protein
MQKEKLDTYQQITLWLCGELNPKLNIFPTIFDGDILYKLKPHKKGNKNDKANT